MASRTMFDKVWDLHVVADLGGDMALLHADRILVHDLSGARATSGQARASTIGRNFTRVSSISASGSLPATMPAPA